MTAGRGAAALAKHSATNFAALLHNNVHMFTRDEEIRMGPWWNKIETVSLFMFENVKVEKLPTIRVI